MTSKPTLTKHGLEARDTRRRRQAEALRANLARRKAQGSAPSGPADRTATRPGPAGSKDPGTEPGNA